MKLKLGKFLVAIILFFPVMAVAQLKYEVQKDKKSIAITSAGITYFFSGNFTVVYNETDPNLAMRPAGIKSVNYNVPSWKVYPGKAADLIETKASVAVGGDGLDDRIIKSGQKGRTVSIKSAGKSFDLEPVSFKANKDEVIFSYPTNELFSIEASVVLKKTGYPQLKFALKTKKEGYFSVAYSGAPQFEPTTLSEIWQPLVWQEKRFPILPYVTTAHMSTVPSTLSYDGKNSVGLLSSPIHIPFSPLPVLENSQFGISLRNDVGKSQSRIFAPLFGGYQSKMKANHSFSFSMFLVVEPQTISYTYEKLARDYFGFKDYRKNDISNINSVIDNMVDYVQTKYAWYIDSLKGFSYSTDVPGAVKNVSSLNPIDLALITDNEQIFKSRGYPLMEFMLSREKTLFALDSTQKIQSPSRKLNGKVALSSELVALYNIFNKSNPFLLAMAQQQVGKEAQNGLAETYKGTWTNAMHLYKATGNKTYLRKAIAGANSYLKTKVSKKQETFSPSSFFWPKFTNQWIDLLQLFEITKDSSYLKAAHEGARNYTMFTYMVPKIPDSLITVNKGGKAPIYWYLQSKGHKQMSYPEEQAPAWRLSEVGLTAESSGTSAGHRAIFMANYAPWMLKVGYYTNDKYLQEVAKAAIVGRYRNFPGYHINTARTTAYEKLDFPLHNHKDQSVNSFHYNHIMPMASMLIDYLVTDVFVRSKGKISFDSEFVEAYAYLQNNIYGAGKGTFYDEKDVRLWMPSRLLNISNVELNYLAARKDGKLFLSFTNQSAKPVTATITLNKELVALAVGSSVVSVNGDKLESRLKDYTFTITVPANGISSVKIDQVQAKTTFQDKALANMPSINHDFVEIKEGNAKAMLIRLGNYSDVFYAYLQDDDNKWQQVKLNYVDVNGKLQSVVKKDYPFEFTVPLKTNARVVFSLEMTAKDGKVVKSEEKTFGKSQ